MKQHSLIKGAFILMLAGFFNRVLGFVLRMILVRVIGDEGLGLFQMVFPVFITCSIITTMGLPVAISKFTSQEMANKNHQIVLKNFKLAISLVIASSLVVVFIFANSANFIANNLLNDPRTYPILLAVAPALFFVSISSILRGFFQGLRIMTPTALSQMIEQVTRMIVTLFVLYKLIEAPLKLQATGVAMGVTIGEAVGFLTLLIIFFFYLPEIKKNCSESSTKRSFILIKKLLKFGVPITLGRLVASLMYSVEAIAIPGKLQQIGYSISEATSLYGQLSGMVLQLIYLPTIITIALMSNLIPAISESAAHNNQQAIRKKSLEAIRLTFYLGMLAVVILFLVPHEITDLIFNYPQAGDYLKLLALPAICMYLSQIFAGIIQGLGQPNLVVKNSIVGLAIELAIIQSVTFFPQLGFNLIILAIGIRYIIISFLHYRSINNQVKLQIPVVHLVLKPILASSLVIAILPQVYKMIHYMSNSDLISLAVSITLSSSFYFAFLVLTNGITKEDLERLKP
ncbi:oligosaccharide flippase family protein [Natroniella sp. ANB-PHB2]|uniref:putative polysaccharide biosynthesis protein n=1 Tax=Natroniella sp. ANB-PHB2 TaxID=3384444 RepID=UPI0038D3B2BA